MSIERRVFLLFSTAPNYLLGGQSEVLANRSGERGKMEGKSYFGTTSLTVLPLLQLSFKMYDLSSRDLPPPPVSPVAAPGSPPLEVAGGQEFHWAMTRSSRGGGGGIFLPLLFGPNPVLRNLLLLIHDQKPLSPPPPRMITYLVSLTCVQ